jgi:hypothetical protein
LISSVPVPESAWCNPHRYLIEIHRVNVIDKTATIVYRTGEVEELNLQEIANEGHMSLIEPM